MPGGSLGTIRGQMVLDFRQAVAAYATVRAANAKTVYAMRGTSETFAGVSKKAGIAGLGIAAGIGLAVKAAATFERKISFFGAVSDTTGAQLDSIRQKALQLGQDTIFSAGQIADAFVELGKSGVSPALIIEGVGDAVAHLGAAADIDLPQAANIITAAVQSFNLNGTQAIDVADKLAGAANASIVDVQDLGVSLKYVGGVAHALGINFGETNTALALLGKYGIKGSTAGTSLRQILLSLTGNSKKAKDQLRELGIVTKDGGNKFFDAQGKAKPLSRIFQILQNSMKGMTKEQQVAATKTIFNNRAMAAALDLTKAGAKGFKDMNAQIGKTTAAEVSAKRLDNLSGDVEILRGNIETLAVKAGSPLQNFLRGIVQGVTGVIQAFANLSPSTQQLILKALALTAGLLLTVSAVTKVISIGANAVKAFKDLQAAFKIASLGLKILRVNFALFNALVLSNPIALIVIAVIALVVAFILLYKHSARFRAIVQAAGAALVTAFKAVVNFFKGVPGFFVGVWNTIKNAFSTALNAIVGFFAKWGPLILAAMVGPLGLAIYAVVKFHTQIINFFKSLPGRLAGYASAAVTAVLGFFEKLPLRLAFIIGFMLGLWVRLWLNIFLTAYSIISTGILRIIAFFAALPGRVLAFLTLLWHSGVAIFLAFGNAINAAAAAIYHGVINFFQKLPGRVASFFTSMKNRAIALITALAVAARSKAASAYNGVVNWFQKLPGVIANFVGRMRDKAVTLFNAVVTKAKSFGTKVYNGIKDGITDLPSLVSGILDRVITAFKDLITRGFSAAKDFAGGLWKGFKSGLGIHSPSFIEKQMVQITKVTADETGRLKRQVKTVQQVGRRLATVGKMPVNNQELLGGVTAQQVAYTASQLARAHKTALSLQKATASISTGQALQVDAGNVQVGQTVTPSIIASNGDAPQFPQRMKLVVGDKEFDAYVGEIGDKKEQSTVRKVNVGKKG